MDLRMLAIFVKVGERRSFVGAAKDLGMTQSGVSNAISRLENLLGVRLVARTTRNVNLTDDGLAFFERCRQILTDLEEAQLEVANARLKPTGTLRVDLPVSYGRIKVVPALGAFRAEYPDLKLALSFTDRHIDLVEEGVDIAIRFGELRDSGLITRRLTHVQFRVVAAPSYLAKHGRPQGPQDLVDYNCLKFVVRESRLLRDWQFVQNDSEVTVTPNGDMSFNDGAALCAAACAGFGLAQLLDYFTDDAIAAGQLEPLLDEFRPKPIPISLVYRHTRYLAPRIRAFIDFMTSRPY